MFREMFREMLREMLREMFREMFRLQNPLYIGVSACQREMLICCCEMS